MNIFEDGTITLKLIGEAGKGFATEAATPTDAELAGILRRIIERLEDVGVDDSGADDVNAIPVVWANVSFGSSTYTAPVPVPAVVGLRVDERRLLPDGSTIYDGNGAALTKRGGKWRYQGVSPLTRGMTVPHSVPPYTLEPKN